MFDYFKKVNRLKMALFGERTPLSMSLSPILVLPRGLLHAYEFVSSSSVELLVGVHAKPTFCRTSEKRRAPKKWIFQPFNVALVVELHYIFIEILEVFFSWGDNKKLFPRSVKCRCWVGSRRQKITLSYFKFFIPGRADSFPGLFIFL